MKLNDPILRSRNTVLAGKSLFLARSGWIFVTCVCIGLLVLIAPKNPRSMFFDPLVEDSFQLMASIMTFRQYLAYLNFLRLLVTGLFFLNALMIFWQKSKDWLALLTSITLMCLPFLTFFGNAFYYNIESHPAPWGYVLASAQALIIICSAVGVTLLLFVFPDGQFVPRRLRKQVVGYLSILLITVIIASLGIPYLNENVWIYLIISYLVLLVTGIIGQIHRYNRISTQTQRQQTKWILFSFLVNLIWAAFLSLRISEPLRFTAASIYGIFELHASVVIISLIPISVAFSVFRYRLWDIDLIIRRTLVYSLLTGTLTGLYFGGVAVFQGVLTAGRRPQNAGEDAISDAPSAIIIVVTTLTIAALFNPLRIRIQNAIDRRFYRQKYDSEKALADFAAAARSETDLVQLSNGLTAAVQETLQPEKVNLWLTH